MTKILLDYLTEGERSELSESQKLRLKSADDSRYYGGQIKRLMDRARQRMKKEKTT